MKHSFTLSSISKSVSQLTPLSPRPRGPSGRRPCVQVKKLAAHCPTAPNGGKVLRNSELTIPVACAWREGATRARRNRTGIELFRKVAHIFLMVGHLMKLNNHKHRKWHFLTGGQGTRAYAIDTQTFCVCVRLCVCVCSWKADRHLYRIGHHKSSP